MITPMGCGPTCATHNGLAAHRLSHWAAWSLHAGLQQDLQWAKPPARLTQEPQIFDAAAWVKVTRKGTRGRNHNEERWEPRTFFRNVKRAEPSWCNQYFIVYIREQLILLLSFYLAETEAAKFPTIPLPEKYFSLNYAAFNNFSFHGQTWLPRLDHGNMNSSALAGPLLALTWIQRQLSLDQYASVRNPNDQQASALVENGALMLHFQEARLKN